MYGVYNSTSIICLILLLLTCSSFISSISLVGLIIDLYLVLPIPTFLIRRSITFQDTAIYSSFCFFVDIFYWIYLRYFYSLTNESRLDIWNMDSVWQYIFPYLSYWNVFCHCNEFSFIPIYNQLKIFSIFFYFSQHATDDATCITGYNDLIIDK